MEFSGDCMLLDFRVVSGCTLISGLVHCKVELVLDV